VAHEIEAHAAEPLGVQARELGVIDVRRHQRNAAVVAVLGGDRVGDHAVVVAVAGRLHDHAALDAEHRVQGE